MTERLDYLISLVPDGKIFADIGCDHGYCSLEIAKREKFSKVIMADRSEPCLNKARQLLSSYNGKTIIESVVSNGFSKIEYADVALIAGMGGEEIILILENSKFLPDKLVLQPMKNVDKVRVFINKKGYKIDRDIIKICDGKFYDFLLLSKGNETLLEDEILFGKDNIKNLNGDFIKKLTEEKNMINSLINSNNLSETVKKEKINYLRKIEKYVKS